MQSISLYFRPISIYFQETERTAEGVKYKITCQTQFFSDEAMTNLLYDKEIILTDVPFIIEWQGVLTDIYTRIENSIKGN